MFSGFRDLYRSSWLCAAFTLVAVTLPTPAHARTLRVCADPANLPFSDDRSRGFENKLAELVARELHADLSYTWWAVRRGFLRNTLNADKCDLVMGVPVGLDSVRTTEPYYRSTFALVTRQNSALADLNSIDDPRFRTLKIGVPLAGDDGANPAPVMALSRRGATDNLVGFPLFDEYRRDVPSAVRAVAEGRVDVAMLWGPVAGAASSVRRTPLRVTPLKEERDGALPFAFSIALGVRHDDVDFARELDRVMHRKHAAVTAILRSFHVPMLPLRGVNDGGGTRGTEREAAK